MNTRTIFRGAALAALLAAMLPLPSSAQIGGFIKKKVKEKIAGTPPANAPASAPSARPSGAPNSGFNQFVLEMTPELLDRFEKGLAAEQATRTQTAPQLAKILPYEKYQECSKTIVETPEGKQAYDKFTAALQGPQEQASKAMLEFDARMKQLARPKCGPTGAEADSLRRVLSGAPEQAGLEASGLTERQYAIVKERILPFCSISQVPQGAGGEARIPAQSGGIFWTYTPTEVTTLRARCARLKPMVEAVN